MEKIINQLKHMSGFECYDDLTGSIKLGFSDFFKNGNSLIDIKNYRTVEDVTSLLVGVTGAVDFDINRSGLIKLRIKSRVDRMVSYFYYIEMVRDAGLEFDLDLFKKEDMVFVSEDMYLTKERKVAVRAVFVSDVRYDISKLPN